MAALRVKVSKVKRLTGEGGTDLLTPPEVSEEIGIDYERTSLLITSGLIASRREPLPQPAREGPGSGRVLLSRPHVSIYLRSDVSRFLETRQAAPKAASGDNRDAS